MIPIGLAWTLTLVSAYMVGASQPPLPPEQGPHGLTDAELYSRIDGGDPLANMSFDQAVVHDPRRIEALILQRVIAPFTLAITKLEHPSLNTAAIKAAMRHAYLERNHRMRSDGRLIDATKLVDANKRAWKMNGEVLRVAFEMSTPEAVVLKQLMADNHQDIRRAFAEAREIASQASKGANSDQAVEAWRELYNVMTNMVDMVDRFLMAAVGTELVDDEIAWIQPVGQIEAMGAAEPDDLFGALSFDEAMGAYEYEEYIVTGHRAPAVGLAQYRRMGGRVFGAN